MWLFMMPSSQALRRTSSGQVPSLSYSQATGRISFSAKSCAISRRAFCSSVSVKSTTRLAPPRLTGQSTKGYPTPEMPANESCPRGMWQTARAAAGRAPGPGSAVDEHDHDEEIRQLLAARNERRVRRGEAPLDVEEELRRLTAPAIDPALREEIRQLVVARNERRQRAGKEPLDVEAEVERQVRELG